MMTKRTFVLFFCLIQLMGLLVLSGKSRACKLDAGLNGFSPFSVETSSAEDFFLYDNTLPRDETIVRSDELEWRENLNNLLLSQRHTSYRFLTIVSQTSPDFHFTQVPKLIRESVAMPVVAKGRFVLPGYYGFLHRLCPF